MQGSKPSPEKTSRLVATYKYRDERGRLLYEVLRYDPKSFRQRRPKKGGGFVANLQGVRRVPYRLPELLAAKAGSVLWVADGEKDVEALVAKGKIATCNSEGAGKHWSEEWIKWFVHFDKVAVIADKDDAGRKAAVKVYKWFSALGITAKIFEAAAGKDVSDHFAAGKGLRSLVDVTVALTAPAATNGAATTNGHGSGVGWTAEACAQWALDKLLDVEGGSHAGRAAVAYLFAQQLRDVPRAVALDAMRIYVEHCPQVDSEGAYKPYTLEAALDTLESSLGSVPTDWKPGVFSGPPALGDALTLEVERQRIRKQAIKIVDDEVWEEKFQPPLYEPTLREELLLKSDPVAWTVEDLHLRSGNTTCTAMFKTGKTVMQLNLAKALVDGGQFLGKFKVKPSEGRVAVWNYELSRDMFREWCRDIGFKSPGRMCPLTLRGYRVPIWIERGERWCIELLKSLEVSTWIVDPFGRAFRGAGSENANDDVGEFLESLDYIKEQAGVVDLFMSVHMGRGEIEENAEHARGATVLDDWPDGRWLLTKDGSDRYFRADGRDVSMGAHVLQFNEGTRELTLSDVSRQDNRVMRHAGFCVDALRNAGEPLSSSELKDQMSGNNTHKAEGIRMAVSLGWVTVETVGHSKLHSLGNPPKVRINISGSEER